ncbi:MAG: 4-hydroxythreonine-4-phosphate dehydrogenase PdxA [Candidatus Hydrogenedentes bacterium]|nr:4-hydroxythreonine-4-phosphate dehydrogenase PdxA [Candidatus Hydrogenedentota bacterium]
MLNDDRPILAITMGDVNGIGPEVLVKALCHPVVLETCRPIVFGDAGVYEQAQQFATDSPAPLRCESLGQALEAEGGVAVLDCGYPAPTVRPGTIDAAAGKSAVEWIKAAVEACQSGTVAGLVTCPIHKECMALAGFPEIGHTELIAKMTGQADYRMCLFAGPMRVVHITGHLPLRQALDAVRRERIAESIRIGHAAMRRLGCSRARIAVAGLNPHAGEAGLLGTEEMTEVLPAIAECRAAGIDCSGPFPPDTIFRRMHEGEFDMVIALYHDQGHIPMKLIAMDEGVNVTLGVPIVRTSVDHGTAFEIAWQGKAREHSLCAAIELAGRLTAAPTQA